jgi:hypothetical protein
MPICERDPWRLQFFTQVSCPDDILIPTDDPDAWNWYPDHRWVYDKLKIAMSQGLACGPHGVQPSTYPVFSKPMMNMKGMGIGSRIVQSAEDFDANYQPGHMWMEYLVGAHVSTDCAVVRGRVAWIRHCTGDAAGDGMFVRWTIHAAVDPHLHAYLADWIARNLPDYTGMMNFETIGGRIIEAHLRFADQWCDLYGKGWVEALVHLYANSEWRFDDSARSDSYSLPLFAIHDRPFRHPPQGMQDCIRQITGVTSLQITFYEEKAPNIHPMPPGGFRIGIVNCTDLASGEEARRALASAYPPEAILTPV